MKKARNDRHEATRASKAKPRKASRPKTKTDQKREQELDEACDIHLREVRGKVIDSARLTGDGGGGSLAIDFTDQTALIIDYFAAVRSTMQADFSDWRTGNPRATKLWKHVSRWT